MEIEQERIVEGSLMQVIKVDPDPRTSTSRRPAPHLIHKRQDTGYRTFLLSQTKLIPVALDWHLSLELVHCEINPFEFQSAQTGLQAIS